MLPALLSPEKYWAGFSSTVNAELGLEENTSCEFHSEEKCMGFLFLVQLHRISFGHDI